MDVVKEKNVTAWLSDAADALPTPCPMCSTKAIVALPPHLLALQPDDTTHVCHPGLGGCNHGFTIDG